MQVFQPLKSRLKLDVIRESPKGGDSSSNSSKPNIPKIQNDDSDELNHTRPLDESNLLDDI